MPLFEYRCGRCNQEFELLVQGRARPECPHCQSTELEKLLSTFGVSSGSPSESEPGACGTCGDPRGPGSC